MFKNDPKRMTRKEVQKTLSKMATLVDAQMRFFALTDGNVRQTTLRRRTAVDARGCTFGCKVHCRF